MINWLRNYFYFTQKERTGIFILLGIVILVQIAKLFLRTTPAAFTNDWASIEQKIDASSPADTRTFSSAPSGNERNTSDIDEREPLSKKEVSDKKKGELFAFDPNTATKEELGKLGLSDKAIKNITAYREKGGVFKKTTDFKKIYSISEEEYQRLEPYIQLSEKEANQDKKEEAKNDKKILPVKAEIPVEKENTTKTKEQIDINTAKIEDFQKLKGIGPTYANRILKFRESLGGFVNTEQVGETFGLPDSVFQEINAQLIIRTKITPRKININTATIDELDKHPYLNKAQAKQIVKDREANGKFESFEELKDLLLGSPNFEFEKILPYLSL